jgi:nucleoid DNA-binding protein
VLNPRKAKDFISDVAAELDLSETLINDVVIYYWQEVRKSLSSLKNSRIHITNLGDFVVKHWKIDEKIKALEDWEETNRQKGLQQITARFKTAETLYDLKNLTKIMDEEKQRKEFIKLHKRKTNESRV